MAELRGPECPDSLRFLLGWLYELHARSGVGMNGMNPLTWGTIGEWSRIMGITPDADEVRALFLLDAVLLNPAEPKGEAK